MFCYDEQGGFFEYYLQKGQQLITLFILSKLQEIQRQQQQVNFFNQPSLTTRGVYNHNKDQSTANVATTMPSESTFLSGSSASSILFLE